MGEAYVNELLPDRHAVLMLMQATRRGLGPEIQATCGAATATW